MTMAPARPYRSALRAAQSRATRGRVLQAATMLFARLGYGGATMRAVASQAGVSVPTVEALFGTKARLLKASIDVAIAGDDEPVPMLDRDWAAQARAAADPESLLATVSGVIAAAQQRSAGLVLSVFEGAASDPELAGLARQMSAQRATMAAWIVGQLAVIAPLRPGITGEMATDTVFALMEPALFDRLTRQRDWTTARYRDWIALSLRHLLVPDEAAAQRSRPSRRRAST